MDRDGPTVEFVIDKQSCGFVAKYGQAEQLLTRELTDLDRISYGVGHVGSSQRWDRFCSANLPHSSDLIGPFG